MTLPPEHESDAPAVPFWTAAGVLAVLALAAIWWPAHPVGTDLPTHLLFANVLWHPERFEGLFATHYAPTAQLWVRLVAPLSGLGTALAAKIGLTVLAGLTVAGYFAVGRALGERRPLGLLFGLAATQSFSVAMGFTNFALAFAIGLFAVSLAVRGWEGERPARGGGRRRWYGGAGFALLLCAHAHVIVAGMVGAFIAVLGASWRSKWNTRRFLYTLGACTPAGLFSIAVAWQARAGYQAAEVAEGLSVQRRPLTEVITGIASGSFGGFSALGGLVLLALVIALAGRACERAWRLPLALVLGVFGALYLVVPYHGEGWAYAQPRVLIPFIFLPAAFADTGRWPRLALATAFLAGALHLGVSAAEHHRQGDILAAQLAAFGERPPGRAMEVVLDPGSTVHRDVEPLLHAAHIALTHGGTTPLLPTYSPMIHSVHALPPPGREAEPPHVPLFIFRSFDCALNPQCATAPDALAQRVAAQGGAFHTILVIGGDETWDARFAARGVIHPDPSAPASRRVVPARATVSLTPPPEAAARQLIVRAGYPDGLGWIAGAARNPAPIRDGVAETLPLGQVPAGPITIEAVLAPTPQAPDGDVVARVEVVLEPGRATTVPLAAP